MVVTVSTAVEVVAVLLFLVPPWVQVGLVYLVVVDQQEQLAGRAVKQEQHQQVDQVVLKVVAQVQVGLAKYNLPTGKII
jgi:hypothetical protein